MDFEMDFDTKTEQCPMEPPMSIMESQYSVFDGFSEMEKVQKEHVSHDHLNKNLGLEKSERFEKLFESIKDHVNSSSTVDHFLLSSFINNPQ